MKFDIETLHPTVKDNVLNVLKQVDISIDQIGLHEKVNCAEIASVKIMESVGLSFEYCNYALNGVPPKGCDNEMGTNWNWTRMYDGVMLEYAIELANKYFNKVSYYEVGMKYPVFNVKLLVKKYNLSLVRTVEPEFSKSYTDPERKTFYDVWQDPDKKYTFSFVKGGIGKGGYAGLVTTSMQDAVKFCKWFLSHKSFYIKDMDLFNNGLGGLSFKELTTNSLL